jgi:hypothetical protein
MSYVYQTATTHQPSPPRTGSATGPASPIAPPRRLAALQTAQPIPYDLGRSNSEYPAPPPRCPTKRSA